MPRTKLHTTLKKIAPYPQSSCCLRIASITHRSTQNHLTATAFAEVQPCTCTQPAFPPRWTQNPLTATAFAEVQLFPRTQPAFPPRCTRNPLTCAVSLHPASVSARCTQNPLDKHTICRGPAVSLSPASVSARCTPNPLTGTAFAEVQLFPCIPPAFQLDVHQIH